MILSPRFTIETQNEKQSLRIVIAHDLILFETWIDISLETLVKIQPLSMELRQVQFKKSELGDDVVESRNQDGQTKES